MLAELAQQEMEAILAERENSASSTTSDRPKMTRKKPAAAQSTTPRAGATTGNGSAWRAPEQGDVRVFCPVITTCHQSQHRHQYCSYFCLSFRAAAIV